jgi:hypothetical protein
MLEIIKKLTEEYENSGYSAAKSCFDEWLNEKKDITQKDEATVKLFMARICLAQEKFDDLTQFFSAGMSQYDKEELENLRRKNAELQREVEKAELKLKEIEKIQLEKEKHEKERIFYQQCYEFKTYFGFGYIFKNAILVNDFEDYINFLPKLNVGYWTLCTRGEFKTIKNKISRHDFSEGPNERFKDVQQHGTFIHPVYFLEHKES